MAFGSWAQGMLLTRAFAFSLLILAGCGSPPRSNRPPPPSAHAPGGEIWQAKLDARHGLVGKAWDVKNAKLDGIGAVEAAVKDARFILLGEKHDNPDHHRLQAATLRSLTATGRRPAVVFEMLDLDMQDKVDAFVARPTPDGFGRAMAWEERGWPEYVMYAPIVDVALAQQLPILAANLSPKETRALMKGEPDPLPTRPLPEALERALEAEIESAHCGHLPASMIGPMSLAQRAKDALMAERMIAGASARGQAVLIAGDGHVRSDRGVPFHLRAAAPSAKIVSVAFVEVQHDVTDPAAYLAHASADWLVFTPRLDDDDPCEAFRHPKAK